MKKKWSIKIILMILLFASSVVVYMSYGQLDNKANLDIDNHRYEMVDLLSAKTLVLDNQLLKQQNHDPFEHYVKLYDVQNIDINGYQWNYNGLIDSLNSYSNSYAREIDYYAIKNNDSQSVLTNTKNDLMDLVNNEDSQLKDEYQWYMELEYNEDGLLQINASDDIAWLSEFYTFDELYRDTFVDSTDYVVNSDEIYQDIYDSITINNPTNITIVYGIQKDISTSGPFYYTFSDNNYSITSGLLPIVMSLLAIIILVMLFLPVRELETMQPFATLVHIKLLFTGVVYAIVGTMWIAIMQAILKATYNGELGYMLRKTGLSGAGPALVPFVNILGWVIFFAMVIYAVFYVKMYLVEGVINSFKKHSLCVAIYRYLKDQMGQMVNFSLETHMHRALLKVVLFAFVYISLCFFTMLICLYIFSGASYVDSDYIGFSIVIAFFMAIGIAFVVRYLMTKVRNNYRILLSASRQVSHGHLNSPIEEDLGLFNSLRDELNQINSGFQEAVENEVTSSKMKTELISHVSHDLKTPLTSMISYIDLLKNPELPSQQKEEYLHILEKSSLRLKTLIEDLFEVSKVNSGNIQLDQIEIDIVSLCQQVMFEHREQFESKHLTVKENYPDHKIICFLDSTKTYRVFENIYQNIYKYALENTRVFVDVIEDENNVELVFKNVSTYEILGDPEKLTERFVQGDESRQAEGSGLGLAIVKSFTEIQGGTLKIETDGDLFKVRLQFAKYDK